MEIYEMIELEDCPRCLGPSILEEENSGYYVMCMDCGCQSATFGFKDDAGRLEAAKRIITISREFGSGGRFIGEETAKKLGIDYYDKDIIGQIAIQSGLLQEYIRGSLNCSGFLGSHTDKFHV